MHVEPSVTVLLYYMSASCRPYIYDEQSQEFHHLQHLVFHKHCLLCLRYIIHRPNQEHGLPAGAPGKAAEASSTVGKQTKPGVLVLLCSAATDGRAAFWHLDHTIEEWIQSRTSTSLGDGPAPSPRWAQPPLPPLTSEESPLCIFELHQSGVNDITFTSTGRGLVDCVSALPI